MKKSKILSSVLIISGSLMIAAAVALNTYNMWDSTRAARSADAALDQIHQIQLQNHRSAQDEDELDLIGLLDPEQELLPTEMRVMTVDGYRYIGTLTFPALEIELPVMDDWDEERMTIAPCRYSGSYLENNMVVCGHNYNTHFGQLQNLQSGDEVIFTDANADSYTYIVETIETLSPTAIDEMKHSDYDLTLFTCTYSNQARVAVRCNMK